jgi:hypothetical protein
VIAAVYHDDLEITEAGWKVRSHVVDVVSEHTLASPATGIEPDPRS